MKSPLLTRNPGNAVAVSADQYLIYSRQTGRLHRLNSTAALLYELCDGSRSSESICKLLSPASGEDPNHLAGWIDQALKDCLLVPVDSAQQDQSGASAKEFVSQATRLRSEGEVLSAFVCQQQATSLRPDNAEYWLELGELAHILGRRDEAREAYAHFVTARPDNEEARHILRALSDEAPPDRAPDECIRQLYSRFSAFYEENMCGDLGYEAPQRIREVLSATRSAARDLTILELGCGTGLAGKVLRPYARHLTGIDLSPEMVEQCRSTGLYDELLVQEITAFLGESLEKGRQFDLIVACDTLIYFGDLQQVVGPAVSLLKQDGLLVFTVEKGEREPFALTDSGRFAHAESHLRSVSGAAGLALKILDEGFLRYEYGEPVTGLVVSLERGGRS